MHLVHDAVQFPEMAREHTAVVTTPRPIAHSLRGRGDACEPRWPREGTRRHPADVEEDDKGATVVVPVTALACDVVGWLPSFDRSRMHPVNDAV
jgi:hypothetical protein